MSDATILVGSEIVRSMDLDVFQYGAWVAQLSFEAAPDLSGTITINVSGTTLTGTIDPDRDGVFAGTKSCRVIGGYNGWSKYLAPKHYHSDGAGVQAIVVAQDAARDAGEKLGAFNTAVPNGRIGIDDVRTSTRTASRVLEDSLGGAKWWVDYAGVTQTGDRAESKLDSNSYQVINYSPEHRRVEIAIDGLASLQIGSILQSDTLLEAQTVREFSVTFSAGEGLRASCWTGGTGSSIGNIGDLFFGLARRATDRALSGVYRYRVTSLVGERIEAQPTKAFLPTVRAVSMWPGFAGSYTELKPGAEVLIQFIDDDPAQPIVTGFAPTSSSYFVPNRTCIGGTTGPKAARVGDEVKSGGVTAGVAQKCVLLPVSGAGAPPNNAIVAGVPCYISFSATAPTPTSADPLIGEITKGSSLVQIAGDES